VIFAILQLHESLGNPTLKIVETSIKTCVQNDKLIRRLGYIGMYIILFEWSFLKNYICLKLIDSVRK